MKFISVQCPRSKKTTTNNKEINYMARVSRYFPQPGSTSRSLTILTCHHSGLAMICHNLVNRAAGKHNSTSSLARKAGQPHLYELSSEISTEASSL